MSEAMTAFGAESPSCLSYIFPSGPAMRLPAARPSILWSVHVKHKSSLSPNDSMIRVCHCHVYSSFKISLAVPPSFRFLTRHHSSFRLLFILSSSKVCRLPRFSGEGTRPNAPMRQTNLAPQAGTSPLPVNAHSSLPCGLVNFRGRT